MIDKELFQQALEVAETALDDLREAENEYIARYGESYRPHRLRRLRDDLAKCEATIAALRDRLARQEQCPHGVDDGCCKECYREATQPARQERDGRPSYWYARSEDGTYIVGQGDVIIAEGMAGEAAEAVVEAFKMNAAQKPARQEQEPVAHSIVAGALFDFMGWLTSRRERLVLSSADDAAPAADAIKIFAEMRSLSINDAQVQEWQKYLATPQPREWRGLTDVERIDLGVISEAVSAHSLIGMVEAALKEKNA